MKKLVIAALTFVAVVCFSSCQEEVLGIDTNPYKSLELSTKSSEFIRQGNDFALQFIDKVNSSATGNYVVSPLSLQFVLGMILDGSQGQTADEICEVLGFGAGDVPAVNEYCKSLLDQLPSLDKKTTLKIANAVVVNKQYNLLADYKKTVTNYYDAYVESISFAGGNAVNKINSWCSRNTAGLIPKIVDNLPDDTIACLLNALYFKSKWQDPFSKSSTSPEVFTNEFGVVSHINTMKKEKRYPYGWNDIFQAVRIPYGNGAFSFVVLLPLEGYKVSDVSEWLRNSGADGWNSFIRTMQSAQVDLWLPRFENEYGIDLVKLLESMGIKTAFNPTQADFSLMTDTGAYVSRILQKAVIKVDEEGSEAAAVTIGTIAPTSAGPDPDGNVVFHADHPFLYLITESSSGAVLFAGRFGGE